MKNRPGGGNAAHHRKVITGQRDVQDGRLASRCRDVYSHRKQVKSRLIGKDYRPLLLLSFFYVQAIVPLSRPQSLPHRVGLPFGWAVADAA